MRTLSFRGPFALALALTVACTPDKESAIDQATDAYCDKSLECGWSEDEADCADAAEEIFEGLWADDDCEEDGLDHDGWLECLEAIDNLNCEDWTMGLSSIGACEADDVCL